MFEKGEYESDFLLEYILFYLFVLGIAFIYVPGTDLLGYILLAFSNIILLILAIYNSWRVHKEDLLNFLVVCSVSLSLVSILFCVFFYKRVSKITDVFNNPHKLNGLAMDVLNMFKGAFVAVFTFMAIQYYLFKSRILEGDILGSNDPSILVKMIFSFFKGSKEGSEDQNKEERRRQQGVVVLTFFTIIVLALTSFNVYVTNFLKSIPIVN
jgi:hypothetical protein